VPAIIMDGKALAESVRQRVAARLVALGSPPVCLATVLVGDDLPSQRYVASKQKQAAAVGMLSRHTDLPTDAGQAEVEAVVADLAADPAVHGILVQLPLPAGLAPDPVIDLIPPAKDVDGLTAASLGRLVRGHPALVPCTPRGIMALLAHYDVPIAGRRAVVVGRSTLVGLPIALLLGAKGTDATVTIAHSRSSDLAAVCREADILVSAVGVGRLVTREYVKPGAAVLDVGISRNETGIVGDVDFDAVAAVAGWVTPMPGGTGAMTPAMLLENTVDAYCLQQGVSPEEVA
jgi:methylenetetrahydrofolate dehydrogenase (NADP+)/methenyltetrahydrofolate cyclohydrolase